MHDHRIIREDTKTIVKNLGEDAHRLSGKTLLLSGGAGFLGKHFIRVFRRLNDEVLERPVRVISVDNFITGEASTAERDPNIAEVWADVTQPLPLREDIHYMMHAAGLASPVYYMKYPLETIESAVSGIRNLLELARTTARPAASKSSKKAAKPKTQKLKVTTGKSTVLSETRIHHHLRRGRG